MKESYNGYCNYETWCLSLHLHNEIGSYSYIIDLVRNVFIEECENDDIEDRFDELLDRLTDHLRSQYEDLCESITEHTDGFTNDIINMSFSRINYKEVASSFVTDMRDELQENYQNVLEDIECDSEED